MRNMPLLLFMHYQIMESKSTLSHLTKMHIGDAYHEHVCLRNSISVSWIPSCGRFNFSQDIFLMHFPSCD